MENRSQLANSLGVVLNCYKWTLSALAIFLLIQISNSQDFQFSDTRTIQRLDLSITRAIQTADMDLDGDLDLVCASTSGKVLWFENLGTSFCAEEHLFGESAGNVTDLQVADLNGDQYPDVVTVSSGQAGLRWYPNLGTGEGQGLWYLILSDAGGSRVELADLDEDGDLDLLLLSDTVSLYENVNGMGSFVGPTLVGGEYSAVSALHVVDLDGDGDADVLLACPDQLFWYENREMSFLVVHEISAALAYIPELDVADLDADGDLDLLCADATAGEALWYENNGSGGFSESHSIATGMGQLSHLLARDLDADGDYDVCLVSGDQYTVSWFANATPAGSFQPAQVVADDVLLASYAEAADLWGDGACELLTVAANEGMVTVYNCVDAQYTWQADLTFSAPECSEFDLFDVDEDGDLDLIAANKGRVFWYENQDASGAFSPAILLDRNAHGPVPLSGEVLDFDQDGDLDYFYYYYTYGQSSGIEVYWLQNLGTGQYRKNVQYLDGGETVRYLTCGDVNGDQLPDVLMYQIPSQRLVYYPHVDQADTFAAYIELFEVPRADYAALVDFDQDDDNDLVLCSGSHMSLYLNEDGAGSYGGVTSSVGIGGYYCHYFGTHDLDLDGDPDIILISKDVIPEYTIVYNFQWIENTNSGNGFGGVHFLGPQHAYREVESVVYANLAGDSRAEVLAMRYWYVHCYTPESDYEESIVCNLPYRIAMKPGDINGDGLIDLVYSASQGQHLGWLENVSDVGVSNPRITQPGSLAITAFPNPFNPSTVINFDTERTQELSLKVYDLQGRLVQTLAEGQFLAGEHEARFDGSALASGLYLVHLAGEEQSAVQRVLLLK